MKIAIMGAGGVGGVLGARLVAAGHEVHFIARGAHLEALRASGLELLSPNGDLRLERVRATDDPATIGPVDVVVFAVKMGDAAEAARRCTGLVGKDTAVVPYLNGVEAPELIATALPAGNVLGGVAYVSAVIDRPGVIRQTGTFQRFVHGELDGRSSTRATAWAEALVAAGIDAVATRGIREELWRKFVLLAANSGLTAATRSDVGTIRSTPELRQLLAEAVAEGIAVARAEKVALPADTKEQVLAFMEALPAEMRSSMQEDLERGKPLELAWLSGAVQRIGARHGIATPVHRFIHAILLPHADGGRR